MGAGAPTWGPWVVLRVRPTISGAWRQGQDRAPEVTGNRTAATEHEKLPPPFCLQTASCPRPHPLVRLPSCGSSCPAPTPTPSAAQEAAVPGGAGMHTLASPFPNIRKKEHAPLLSRRSRRAAWECVFVTDVLVQLCVYICMHARICLYIKCS